MQFRVGRRRKDDARVPRTLRPLSGWVHDAPAARRPWRVTVGTGIRPVWQINGQTFDPACSDAFPVLGSSSPAISVASPAGT